MIAAEYGLQKTQGLPGIDFWTSDLLLVLFSCALVSCALVVRLAAGLFSARGMHSRTDTLARIHVYTHAYTRTNMRARSHIHTHTHTHTLAHSHTKILECCRMDSKLNHLCSVVKNIGCPEVIRGFYSVLQSVAECCSVLQCVAVCCSVL